MSKIAIVNQKASDAANELQNSFPNKFLKRLPSGFTDEAGSMDTEELKKTVVDAEGNLYIINKEKEADQMLLAAKNTAKDLSGAYRDARATQNAKIQYCLFLLEERGVELDTQ